MPAQRAGTRSGRRRPRRERNRAETTARILAAVGEVLARDGFGALGVNAVAKHAGVDKVLIYRYFGGMSELLKAWGESGRFWPALDDLIGDDRATFFALPLAERYARFFEHFIDGLRARPLTLEIMAARTLRAQRTDRDPRDRARAVGRRSEPPARQRRLGPAAGVAGDHAAARRRRAVPADPQSHDPPVRRPRHPQRRRLGGAEGRRAPARARSARRRPTRTAQSDARLAGHFSTNARSMT
jgi:AcrR family transcriptional regulator